MYQGTVTEYHTEEVTEEGKPSIAEQVKMITCTNECSGHGICINGNWIIKLKTQKYQMWDRDRIRNQCINTFLLFYFIYKKK